MLLHSTFNWFLEIQTQLSLNSFILISILAMVLMLVFLFLTIFFFQKRMLAKQQEIVRKDLEHQKTIQLIEQELILAERKKVQQDLHDGFSIHIHNIKKQVELLQEVAKSKAYEEQLYEATYLHISNAHQELRGILYDVLPATLQHEGFLSALNDYIKHLNTIHSLNITTTFANKQFEVNEKKALHLFRILQELLNNVLKYANATKINVSATLLNNALAFTINHNGAGIDTAQINELKLSSKGAGLKNLDNRSFLINATIKYAALPSPAITVELSNN